MTEGSDTLKFVHVLVSQDTLVDRSRGIFPFVLANGLHNLTTGALNTPSFREAS